MKYSLLLIISFLLTNTVPAQDVMKPETFQVEGKTVLYFKHGNHNLFFHEKSVYRLSYASQDGISFSIISDSEKFRFSNGMLVSRDICFHLELIPVTELEKLPIKESIDPYPLLID